MIDIFFSFSIFNVFIQYNSLEGDLIAKFDLF